MWNVNACPFTYTHVVHKKMNARVRELIYLFVVVSVKKRMNDF